MGEVLEKCSISHANDISALIFPRFVRYFRGILSHPHRKMKNIFCRSGCNIKFKGAIPYYIIEFVFEILYAESDDSLCLLVPGQGRDLNQFIAAIQHPKQAQWTPSILTALHLSSLFKNQWIFSGSFLLSVWIFCDFDEGAMALFQ